MARGALFSLMPVMEGRWNGNMVIFNYATRQASQSRVCSSELFFDHANTSWIEREMITSVDGTTAVHTQRLHPVGNGVVQVQEFGDLVMYADCDTKMTENGTILTSVALKKNTGKPRLIQTIVLVNNLHRVRTSQLFNREGALLTVTTFNENRVIDGISGAVEKRMPSGGVVF